MGRVALVVVLTGYLLVDSVVLLLGDFRLGFHENLRLEVAGKRTLSECIISDFRCIRRGPCCSLRLRGGAIDPVLFDSDEIDDLPWDSRKDWTNETQLPSAAESLGHGQRQSQAVVDRFREAGLRLPQDYLAQKPKTASVKKEVNMSTEKVTNVDLTSLFGLDAKEAAKKARREGKVLLVFVPDDSPDVSTTKSLLWSDEAVRTAATCECVPLCVLPGTMEASWLFQAHGQPASLPALYTVSSQGDRLETLHGDLDLEAVLAFIDVSLARVGLGDLTSSTLGKLRRERERESEREKQEVGAGADDIDELDGLFDRVFESEMARRQRETRQDMKQSEQLHPLLASHLQDDPRTAMRRRWVPAEEGAPGKDGGGVVRVPRDFATMEGAVRAATNNSVVRVAGGEYAWRWDLEVCDARLRRRLFDADRGVYVSERYAMEKTMQKDCLPRMEEVLREHLRRQGKESNASSGSAEAEEAEERDEEEKRREGGEHTCKEEEGGAKEEEKEEERTLCCLDFEGGGEALLRGRWWMKLGTQGRLTKMRCEHSSDGTEPCAHTPPHSIRISPDALTPWNKEEEEWESRGGGDVVYLVGPFEEPDALLPSKRTLCPYMRLNLSMIENDEGMWLGSDGRWRGEHRGGLWDGNRFQNVRAAPEREELEIDAHGMAALGDDSHAYFVCDFCTPRVRNVFNVQGGPWVFAECELRGGRVTVLRASHSAARVELVDSWIGGMNGFDAEAEAEKQDGLVAGMWERTQNGRGVKLWSGFDKDMRASYGVSGMACGSEIRVSACVLEDCGFMEGAACQFTDGATGCLDRCLLQNNGRAIGVGDQSRVSASDSQFRSHRNGALFAMASAKRATLELHNNIFRGRLWADMQRPGTLLDRGNQYSTLKRRGAPARHEPRD